MDAERNDPPPLAPSPSKSVKLFDDFGRWLGAAVMLVALYYDLERGTEVHIVVYGLAGGLMGLGTALRQAFGK